MLIIKKVIGYILTHSYSQENAEYLHEMYAIWGKGRAAEMLHDLWKEGCFNIDVIPVDWIQDRIEDLEYEEQAWNIPDMNIDKIDVLEKLLKDWENK